MHTNLGTAAPRRWALGGVSVVLALVVAGCGSDEGSGGAEQAGGASPPETSPASDPAEFCEAAVDAEAALSGGPPVDFETATPEEIQAALEEYGAQVEPVLARVEETAPEEVSEPVTTQADLIREALETGDETVFDRPEFTESDRAIDEFMLESCGFEQIEVTGIDHEYEGVPATVPAGTVAVTFTNEGEEMHELGMARINDDVTQSVEELLALPEEQVGSMVTFVGGAFAEPGGTDTTFLRLEPGRYGGVCFIPEGSTPGTEGSGPPHFTLGMFTEFTVE